MRKSIAILFLSITFIGVIGYNFILEVIKEHHKEEMMEKLSRTIPESELSRVSADADGIYWLEEDKEFLYNKEMYDVVKRVTEDGKEILLCISDTKEKQLTEKQNSNVEDNTPGTPAKGGKHISGKHVLDLFADEISSKTNTLNYDNNTHFAVLSNPAIVSGWLDKAFPPPRI